MRQKILFFIIACSFSQLIFAQNIGINETGAVPDASAILDVSATNKGMLVPRMTSLQRTAIATPATGLQVYDTDAKSFWYYNGTAWIELSTGSSTNFWGLNGTHIFNNNAGNVGIGLNTPLAPLHIKNDNEALRIQGNTPYLSFTNNAGEAKGFLQSFNNDLYLGTPATNTTGNLQFYAANTPALIIKPTADVVVGADASNSFGKLTVQTLNNSNGISHLGEGGNILATRMGGTSAGIGTFSNTNMRIFSNNNSAIFINSSNSYVGLGGDFPVNKFQIGTIANPGPNYVGNDFAISNGTNAMRIYQSSNSTVIASDNTNMVFWPKEATGNVGINTLSQPTNKLQIGSVGGTGFATNDLAIGNGTAAMAIYQTNASTLIGSTTDIILRPRNNGGGFVGINTNTPRAPLDVTSFTNVSIPGGSIVYSYLNQGSGLVGVARANDNPVPQISIVTDGRILSTEFDAYSDARIKNINGITNAQKDLQIINALQITDYSMKDKVRYGNQQFKKVIAQDVEKVYPQVVSKHTDFIPNVYQLANKVEKTANGYLISFSSKHNISPSAKKLQMLLSDDKGMEQFAIISIPSETKVLINASDIKADKVFVYGEEVDDFRTVDYEGLTTLNISATQELNKLLVKQQALIVNQQKQLDYLEKRLSALEAKPVSKLLGMK
ncbi:tail fiber domain-containing protein [Flavitalea flava]